MKIVSTYIYNNVVFSISGRTRIGLREICAAEHRNGSITRKMKHGVSHEGKLGRLIMNVLPSGREDIYWLQTNKNIR